MKRLTVHYDGRTIFDGDVAEFRWSESDGEITIKAGERTRPTLGDLFRDAAEKAQTQIAAGRSANHQPASVTQLPPT